MVQSQTPGCPLYSSPFFSPWLTPPNCKLIPSSCPVGSSDVPRDMCIPPANSSECNFQCVWYHEHSVEITSVRASGLKHSTYSFCLLFCCYCCFTVSALGMAAFIFCSWILGQLVTLVVTPSLMFSFYSALREGGVNVLFLHKLW